ncbi:glycosyltransferase family 2 protein [Deinococcus sonorensis]|uniref:Glycosyltransferase n=2 Tax=Deinococcus sonorensis TaxID=309891 RepID=A0AAU7UEN2_9DEIO
MASPLISVLVPAYNHAGYIETCLESIRLDPYPQTEVLVLDDGSMDDTLGVAQGWCGKFGHHFVRVQVATQANQGIAATLNTLIRSARGEYVAILASDDLLLPGGLQARATYLLEHPTHLAVFGDCQAIDEHGRLLHLSAMRGLYRSFVPALHSPAGRVRELILRWSVPGPGLMVRRSAYLSPGGIGLYDAALSVEDRPFYLKLLSRNALGFLGAPVAQYRVHSRQSVRSEQRQMQLLHDVVAAEEQAYPDFVGSEKLFLSLVIRRNKAQIVVLNTGDPLSRLRLRFLNLVLRAIYLFHIIVIRWDDLFSGRRGDRREC